MGTEWDEIKRLAADFQKAQVTSTLQKLSERNCIEIVSLLLEKHLLEVIFTNDGKEYVTPAQLAREIQDELYVHGGRVNLVEVSKTLNVDLSRINDVATNIQADDPTVNFILGQLIDDQYIMHIAEEINEKLSQKGEINVSDLTEQFDLPSDFLQHNVMEKYLGKVIRGRQDPMNPRIFFTQAHVQRCKAKIRGALAGITRPTKVTTILQQINVQEKIFFTLFDEVAPAGQLTARSHNAEYVPYIYAKIQFDWIESFYKQNGFLEYDAIVKLGITDPKQYIRSKFAKDEITFLKNCAVGSKLLDLTVLSSLTECQTAKSYVDLANLLPSNMSDEDIEEVYDTLITRKTSTALNNFVYLDKIVFSQQFLADLTLPCQETAFSNAKTAVDSGVYQQYLAQKLLAAKPSSGAGLALDTDGRGDKRDERRKKASSGKAGGGSQGRETKTKATKKRNKGAAGRADADSDSGDEKRTTSVKASDKSMEFITVEEIVKTIHEQLKEEDLDHLEYDIAKMFCHQLNQLGANKAQELLQAIPQTSRRQTHADTQEKINTLLTDLRLYEKGLRLMPADVHGQLEKYLLKSLGNDIANEIASYVADECNLALKTKITTAEQRQKVAQECDEEYKLPLLEMNKALNKAIADFLDAIDMTLKACSMIIKKTDKKKDRQIIAQHREKLIEQLRDTDQASLALHLVVLIIFTTVTGCLLHASGKFVAQIIKFLKPSLKNNQNDLLSNYHDLVLKSLQTDAAERDGELLERVEAMTEEIKQLGSTYENSYGSKKEESQTNVE